MRSFLKLLTRCCMRSLKNNRGSMTIEAVWIVSTLILIIAGIVFAFMLMYQKTLLAQAATNAAQQGAEIWADPRRDMSRGLTGEDEKLKLGELYSALVDFGTEYEATLQVLEDAGKAPEEGKGAQEQKFNRIRQMVCDELYRGLLKPKDTKLRIDFGNTVLERKITVTIQQEIRIPLGGIMNLFGNNKTITLTGTGTSVVADPAEYIRNLDLGLEYAHRAADATGLKEKLTALKDRFIGKR